MRGKVTAILLLTTGILLLSGAKSKPGSDLDPSSFAPEMQAEVRHIAEAYQKLPNEAAILYQVAALQAKAGRKEQAMETLKRMASMGAGLDPGGRGFESLKDDRDFQRLKAQIRHDNPPVMRARLAYEVAEGNLISEGIAYSAKTRKLYLGGARKIVSVAEDGKYEIFVPLATGGLGDVVGVRVDDQRGELWAVSNSFVHHDPDIVPGLFRFRLADGSLIKSYPIPTAEKEAVNDVAVTKDGTAFATASDSGALYRVDPKAERAEKFLPDGALPDPNGIVATEDGKSLFVAGWYSISKVEISKKRVTTLDKPKNVADGCVDGLYLYRESDLIGVQNCAHESGRVMRFKLDGTRTRILSAQVLESYNPMFDLITTAAIAGDDLYFVANTQLRKAGKPDAHFDPLKILRLSLK
jgi:sugar lactone lactonase YvrE